MTGSGAVRFKVELGSKGRRDAPARHQQPGTESEATDPPAEAKHKESRQPTRAARMLALGHLIERAIEAVELADYAEASRRFGVSRPRLTQVVNLTLLSPKIQAAIVCGQVRVSERDLRQTVTRAKWKDQEHGLL